MPFSVCLRILVCSALFMFLCAPVQHAAAQENTGASADPISDIPSVTNDIPLLPPDPANPDDPAGNAASEAVEKESLAQEALKKASDANGGDMSVKESGQGMENYYPNGRKIDMGEAVREALSRNYSILSSKTDTLAAEDLRKSALGDFFPSVSVQYGYTKLDHEKPTRDTIRASQSDDDVWELGVNVHQDIFTGFRLSNNFQRARLNKQLSEHNLAYTELNLILSVQQNFLNLLKAREDVRSARDSVTRLTSQLRVTQAFYDVGLRPKLDVLQAEVDLAQAEDQLLQARNAVATQQARLNTLLTEPLDAPINYTGELLYTPFSLTLQECLAKAYDKRPDLEVAKRQIEIARKDANIAFSELLPQVGADVNLSRTGDSFTVHGNDYGLDGGSGSIGGRTEFSQWSVSVNAEWKLFDFGSTWYGWRSAQKGIYKNQADEQDLREEIAYQIKSSHLNITETEERIKVARKALEQAKESYRMAVARYQAQVGTNTDVLDAQARLTEAEASLTQALADYQLSLSDMYAAMGERNYTLLPE